MSLSVGLLVLLVAAARAQTPDPGATQGPIRDRQVVIPPLIYREPPQIMAFRVEESIEMPCVASGEPEPTYKWQFNNEPFDPSGLDGRVAIQPGVGTLIFARPIPRDEGIYQCFAENIGGVSISVKIDLRVAILEPFQPSALITHRPQVGSPLTLKCTPPRSFPKAEIFWTTVREGETFQPIDLTARVALDPEGSLHIAHVKHEDRKDGRTYACVVQNKVVRGFQQGDYQKVDPQGDMTMTMAPTLMWQSPTHQVSLREATWRIKCIFSGRPTPRVDWARLDGKPMPNRARQESFGQELVIEKVQMDDAGKYECQGINDAAVVPTRRSFDLKVEASPYWKHKPQSRDAAEAGSTTFICEAYGLPDPTYDWFINGRPINEIPSDPRRIVTKNEMTFNNLTRDDVQVIQCNATNKHGYIFANAYLNVLTEPPTITEPPLVGQKAAEDQTITLRCTVFGSPKPLVVWRKGSEQLTGGRFRVLENGHLEITDVSLVDAGTYVCSATNKLGQDQAEGTLIVRRKTRIQTYPLGVTVYEGTEAKFICTGTTDPEEVRNLQITWKKDGDYIDYRVAQRMFKNVMDNSLTISGTIARDTAKYTCVASNGIDSDEASAQLIVQGVPEPPTNVRVERFDKSKRLVTIVWQPSMENYAPILNFIIQFNTTFTPDTWVDIASNISQNQRQADIELSPWCNFTFRVLARNKVGLSHPSQHTELMVTTEPAAPEKNPENVIGEGDQPNNLIIYWTPMPKIEQNAESFYYLISWKRQGINEQEKTHRVDDPVQYRFITPDQNLPTYVPFEISVKAANAMGDATKQPEVFIGYSGEDTPTVFPTDVMVEPNSVKATEAYLTWTQVDYTPEKIRGFFRGYRIQFWRTADGPEHMREQDVVMRDPPYYRPPRSKRSLPGTVRVRLQHLPPNSEITFQVIVFNKYYAGPPSPQGTLTTLEGKPGPPALFQVRARGATHFDMTWMAPREPNGVLIGYNMSYQSITGLNMGRLQYRKPITDPSVTRAQLSGLQPQRLYRVFLSAVTQAGQGEPIFLDMSTTPAGPPSRPTFGFVDFWETAVNITWEPSRTGNPGSVFFSQYRPRGQYLWENTPDEYDRNWVYIENLEPGTVYQARVVAKNGAGQEAPAELQDFKTSGFPPGDPVAERSPWFYGMFGGMLLIIALVIGFFFLKRVTDQRWESKENEREEQIRTLQAQIATEQMGIVNQYADTGSRDYTASYTSEKKPPINEEFDSDEEYDQRYNQPPYNPAQQQYSQDQYYGQQPQQYTDTSYGQPGMYAEPPGPDSYAQVPGDPHYSQPPVEQVGYRKPQAGGLSGAPATGITGSPAMMGVPQTQIQGGYNMPSSGAGSSFV